MQVAYAIQTRLDNRRDVLRFNRAAHVPTPEALNLVRPAKIIGTAGNHAIGASHVGFYAEMRSGYLTHHGRERVYSPLYLERCPKGNCDPAKRAKKPLVICE